MPGSLEVHYIEVTENPVLLQAFNLKAKCIMCERTLVMSKRTLVNFGVLWLQNPEAISRIIFSPFSSVNDIYFFND